MPVKVLYCYEDEDLDRGRQGSERRLEAGWTA